LEEYLRHYISDVQPINERCHWLNLLTTIRGMKPSVPLRFSGARTMAGILACQADLRGLLVFQLLTQWLTPSMMLLRKPNFDCKLQATVLTRYADQHRSDMVLQQGAKVLSQH